MSDIPSKDLRAVTLPLSEENAEDVREMGEMCVRSHEVPGERDDRQSWEWHQGKRLLALADQMETALRETA